MTIRFSDAFTRADWIKIGILIVVASGAWYWVYLEYQKPLVDDNWQVPEIHSPQP